MENDGSPASQVSLTPNDISAIDQFRRLKSTAVLTILFTDIKGFTRMTEERGEAYANKLRREHDDIVTPILERDGGGRVIKHIGDSVMAVFSEPSTAVGRAVEVQTKLAQFNSQRPEEEKLEVRMGLHCGQVTTEDSVNADVFGRHVNRASRVEALADGGQVLVTYTVFDSARGWLHQKSDIPVSWEKHGHYMLKGIPDPIEIWEAYNPEISSPKAPPGGKKAAGLPPRFFVGAALILLIAVIVGMLAFFQVIGGAPEVSVVDYKADWAKLWNGEPFHVGGEPGQHIRPVLTPLEPGHHMLFAETSQIVRSFAPFDVKRGKNVLDINFDRDELPGMTRRIEYEKGGKNELKESSDDTYTSYDAQMNAHQNTSHIDLALKAEPDPEDAKRIKFTCTWTVLLNGVVISQGSVSDHNILTDSDIRHQPKKILWSDDFHFYYLSYYMSANAAEFTVEANFADYKNK